MPRDSKDLEGARAITRLGYPAVDPALSDIVRCMRIAHSAVAEIFADFLGTIGASAVPAIANELLPNENLWLRDLVFRKVLPQWPAEDVMKLRGILMTIASLNPDPYNNDIRCIQILTDRGLADRAWLQDLIDSKLRWWNERHQIISIAKDSIAKAEQD